MRAAERERSAVHAGSRRVRRRAETRNSGAERRRRRNGTGVRNVAALNDADGERAAEYAIRPIGGPEGRRRGAAAVVTIRRRIIISRPARVNYRRRNPIGWRVGAKRSRRKQKCVRPKRTAVIRIRHESPSPACVSANVRRFISGCQTRPGGQTRPRGQTSVLLFCLRYTYGFVVFYFRFLVIHHTQCMFLSCVLQK